MPDPASNARILGQLGLKARARGAKTVLMGRTAASGPSLWPAVRWRARRNSLKMPRKSAQISGLFSPVGDGLFVFCRGAAPFRQRERACHAL